MTITRICHRGQTSTTSPDFFPFRCYIQPSTFKPFLLLLSLYLFFYMADSFTSSGLDTISNITANGSIPLQAPLNHAALSTVIRKKLMGYVGFANLPNQVRRKSVRKGFQFTAMVVGSYCSSSTCDVGFSSIYRRVWSWQVDLDKHAL